MRTQDLKALSQLGNALWADLGHCGRVGVETVTAVSLLDLTDERKLERAANALVQRAARDGVHAVASHIESPFYRLLPEERFILSALHVVHWSYPRIARVLGKTPEEVEEMAWAARLTLAYRPGQTMMAPHPTGSNHQSVSCPEYHPRRPWTQAFLDDEMGARQKIFLQNHLVGCPDCQKALNRCRSIYYSIDALVPRSDELDALTEALRTSVRRASHLKDPASMTFAESLSVFFARKETRRLLLVAGILMAALVIWR